MSLSVRPKIPELINVHTHVQSKEGICILSVFAEELDSFLAGTSDNGVLISSGIHPWNIDNTDLPAALKSLEKALINRILIAVGECGMDRSIETGIDLQRKIFLDQAALAEKYSKPVIIHSVRSSYDLIKLRKDNEFALPWIFHSFGGSAQEAREIIKSGSYISFGENILRSAKLRKEIAIFAKDREFRERFFLETDGKDITIMSLYDQMSALTGLDLTALKTQILNNFNKCFYGNS